MIGLKAAAFDRAGAWDAALALDGKAFDQAGGDGHSRANLLYWIATRDPGLERMATPVPTVSRVVSPAPVASPVPDCVDGPGRAAAKARPATAPHVLRGSGQRRLRPGALVACRLRAELQAAQGLSTEFRRVTSIRTSFIVRVHATGCFRSYSAPLVICVTVLGLVAGARRRFIGGGRL